MGFGWGSRFASDPVGWHGQAESAELARVEIEEPPNFARASSADSTMLAATDEVVFTLGDHLDHTWSDELVSYQVEHRSLRQARPPFFNSGPIQIPLL